jgi:membrane protein DedA with SNARE-associated domain
MSFATVLACGLFGAPPRKALTAIYLANLLYFAVTVVLGRILGERWYEIIKIGKQFWPWLVGIILVLVLVAGVVWIGRHWRR